MAIESSSTDRLLQDEDAKVALAERCRFGLNQELEAAVKHSFFVWLPFVNLMLFIMSVVFRLPAVAIVARRRVCFKFTEIIAALPWVESLLVVVGTMPTVQVFSSGFPRHEALPRLKPPRPIPVGWVAQCGRKQLLLS